MKENITFLKPSAETCNNYPYRKGTLWIFKGYSTNPKNYPYLVGRAKTDRIKAQCVGTGEIVYVRPYVLAELTGKE